MEAIFYSETWVDFERTKRRYISEDSTALNHGYVITSSPNESSAESEATPQNPARCDTVLRDVGYRYASAPSARQCAMYGCKQRPCHSLGGQSPGSHRDGSCSSPGQVMCDLGWTKCNCVRFSPSTSVPLANSEPTDSSTFIIMHHPGKVQCVKQWPTYQVHPMPIRNYSKRNGCRQRLVKGGLRCKSSWNCHSSVVSSELTQTTPELATLQSRVLS
jgi:hypothetical protein